MNDKLDTAATTRRVVEELFECGKIADIEGIRALLDENVVVYEPPFLPYGGKYEGRDAFIELFALVQEYFEDTKMTPQYIAVEGPHAVVINHIPGKRGEKVVLAEEMLVKGGKVVEVRIYVHQSPAVELNGFAGINDGKK